MNAEVLAKNFKNLLRKKGISQYKLRQVTDLSRGTIENIANGCKNGLPTTDTVIRVCEALDITVSDFFRDEERRMELSDAEILIIENFRQCDLVNQERMLAYSQALVDSKAGKQ